MSFKNSSSAWTLHEFSCRFAPKLFICDQRPFFKSFLASEVPQNILPLKFIHWIRKNRLHGFLHGRLLHKTSDTGQDSTGRRHVCCLFSTESPLCSVDFYAEGLVTANDKNMAGACSICQALRLNSALRKCLRFRYFPPKLKYAVPAAFLSSVGFLGSQCSTESSISASLVSQGKHLPIFSFGSRSFRTTAFQRERASQESDDVKTGSKKIKAKPEQMKEMVRKNQGYWR